MKINKNIIKAKTPMDSKAKYRCRLGMLKVNKLRNRYLNVMKLENYSPRGES